MYIKKCELPQKLAKSVIKEEKKEEIMKVVSP